ncbi:MAG: site-specific integrase [Bacteroidetes bacterium]|nr:site-specific integrase [Bacteroidota bacterium]
MIQKITFSVLFYIKTDKKDSKGKSPIYYRITVNGKKVEGSINSKVLPSRWDGKGHVKGTKEDALSINSHIDTIRSKIYAIKRDLEDRGEFVTAKAIKNRLVGVDKRHKTILEVFNYHNKQMKELEGKTYASATVKRYETTLNHIKDFIEHEYGTNNMYLKQLEYSFITNLEKYFKVVKDCNHNTAIKYIKNVKKVINLAILNDWLDKDPFLKFKPKLKRTERTFLDEEELLKIEHKKISIPRLEMVRDIFIFSCYTGLAYIDVANLKPDNLVTGIDGEKWIFTHRQKTGELTRIPLLQQPLKIIDKYKDHPKTAIKDQLLPISSNQKTNAYLKEIADICGIKKEISFHVARHTCATWMLTKGVSIETVSKILGHSTIKETKYYARILESKISKDFSKLRKEINSSETNPESQAS